MQTPLGKVNSGRRTGSWLLPGDGTLADLPQPPPATQAVIKAIRATAAAAVSAEATRQSKADDVQWYEGRAVRDSAAFLDWLQVLSGSAKKAAS